MSQAPVRSAPSSAEVGTAAHRRELRQHLTEDLLFDGLDRSWMTWALSGLIATIHLGLGWAMYSRGSVGLVGLIVAERGPNMLVRSGAMRSARLDDGEVWRLLSAVFLHADGLHIGVNLLALWALGRICEAVYGPSRFLWLFLVSGAAGFALSWLGGNSLSVGASGGVFGLMGAAIVFGWRHRDDLPERIGRVFRRRLLPWVVLNLALGAVLPFVDNLGHVGGLVGGTVLGMVLGNRVVPGEQTPAPVRLAMLLLSLGAMAACGLRVWANWAR